MEIDLLIKNGTVVDGTRRPRFRADVAVVGDKVVEIGKIKDSAKRVIDASDLKPNATGSTKPEGRSVSAGKDARN